MSATWVFKDSEGYEDSTLYKEEVQEICKMYMETGLDFEAEFIYEEEEEK